MRPSVSSPPRVAVIGGGISGLFCARTLRDRGLEVTVFDKGREVGGRMSARHHRDGLTFDHGAQYFTARNEIFKRYVAAWVERSIVARWDGRIANIGAARWGDPPEGTRFVGVPGMNAVCKHLARDLPVKKETRIVSIEQDTVGGWLLQDETDEVYHRFDTVVLAMPPAQASALLPTDTELRSKAALVSMRPCYALMVAFSSPLEVPFDAAFVESSRLSWIAKMGSKPGQAKSPERWVLHSSTAWSEQHLEDDLDWVRAELLDAMERAIGRSARPKSATVHRWRFAIPLNPLSDRCLFDSRRNLGACGDWCSGPRVEDAFLSGAAMADRILGALVSAGPTKPFS